jgi:hypothetical protein
MAEAVMVLTCIGEVPGSKFGWALTMLEEVSRGFPQFLKENADIVPQIKSRPLPFTHYPIYRSPSSNHSTLYGQSYLQHIEGRSARVG